MFHSKTTHSTSRIAAIVNVTLTSQPLETAATTSRGAPDPSIDPAEDM